MQSIINSMLQISIGMLILIKSRLNFNNGRQKERAYTINNIILWFVFGVTTINIFISAFGVDPNLNQRRDQLARDSINQPVSTEIDLSINSTAT